jgi:hypothetical protein
VSYRRCSRKQEQQAAAPRAAPAAVDIITIRVERTIQTE